ncbi:hypothetical protein CTAM01_08978 [Colletotrichum tamarilloi]|uniref:Uncharacterized protein n=1 Tax=Colletotrichum tamarilloi TaxID=1209934 RepID=A0ABQ9R4T4_9PEZI|nr:uncharacterized protein CTAM01_08978 [Colletotrichum tamarilloi]KAK1494624.1 hypothetical protein CTAM01_08978 [Colletotrichum tamarilloi]
MASSSKLEQLRHYLSSLDPKNLLEGVSFHYDTANELGFKPGDPFDFFVATPFGKWSDTSPPIPNVVAAAVSEALVNGMASKNISIGQNGSKYMFIDLLTLAPFNSTFFTKGISPTLNKLVNGLPSDVTPVIRLLCGDNGITAAQFKDASNGSGWNDYKQIFWSNNQPSITHPKAELYIGFYNPDFKFQPGGSEAWVKKLQAELKNYLNNSALSGHPWVIDLATILVSDGLLPLAKVAESKGLPALSWNHAKVTAVNGTTMTTGGANLWDSYGDTQVGTFDSMVKIRGDAAIEAHKYADAFYLNDIPSDDNASFRHSIKLSGPTPTGADSFQADTVPLFSDTKQSVKNSGSQAVLTTSNVGDRLPGSGKHRYPILVLNVVKDILMQLVYMQTTKGVNPSSDATPDLKVMNTVIDVLSDQSILPAMQRFGLSPAVWASKAARFHAIENATSNITLAQEIFVEPFLRGNPGANAIKGWLNTKLGLDWDEYVVPYDVMQAMCKGLLNIVKTHPQDKSFGMYILLTTKDAGGGYGDPYSWKTFREILTGLLGAQELPSGTTAAEIIQDRLHCKRIMQNDNRYGQHKYNEQHGVWIDDTKNIEAWYSQYFDIAWEKGADIKLSTIIVAVVGFAATSVNAQWYPARNWTNCIAATGGNGTKGIREAHAFFNEAWGRPRLRIQQQSSYAVICYGLIFGIVNDDKMGWFEAANDRDIVALEDPGTASECKWYPRAHEFTRYYFFGREREWIMDNRAYIRRCNEVERPMEGT